MLSISFGLMRLRKLPSLPLIPPCSRGTPSNTISGSLLAFSEAPPRTRIVLPEVGEPLLDMICTPEIFPLISCSGELTSTMLKSLLLTFVTEPVRSLLRCVPYPMTTTSLSTCESLFICTFSTLPFAGIAITLVSYPT